MGIGASIFLLAIGAILAFAVGVNSTAVGGLAIEWNTVGFILMVVGAIGLVWSLLAMSAWRDRNSRTDYVERPVERDRIIER